MKYDFPAGLKPAQVRKRERFYREEFPREAVEQRMERRDQFVPVIDVGTESTLYKPRLQDLTGKLLRIEDWDDLTQLQEKIADYAPEDVYYNLTLTKDGRIELNPEQELVFRIAPHTLSCTTCDRKRGYMDEQWHKYVFCRDCFRDAAQHMRNLYVFLERHFDEMDLVYTGRAFHIHIDDDEGYRMQQEDREELAHKVSQQFPIQKDITAGENDLVRLPGSLNGLVSRTVTPITVEDLTDPTPILTDLSVPASFD